MTSSPSLTDTQLVLLSQASQHPEGKIVPPVHLRGGVFRRVLVSLAGKGLVQSVQLSTNGDTGLYDGDHAQACLAISPAGLAALGIVVEGEAESAVEASAPENRSKSGPKPEILAGSNPTPDLAPLAFSGDDPASQPPHHPRAGSKQAHVLGLLAHPDGTTLDALMAATGWLSHTTRAVLSGLRKRGYAIERVPGGEEGGSRYRLTAPSLVPSCAPVASDPAA